MRDTALPTPPSGRWFQCLRPAAGWWASPCVGTSPDPNHARVIWDENITETGLIVRVLNPSPSGKPIRRPGDRPHAPVVNTLVSDGAVNLNRTAQGCSNLGVQEWTGKALRLVN